MFLAKVVPPIIGVVAIYFVLFLTIGASSAGAITGIVLGSFAIGGLAGWGINRLLRIPYPWADIIALAVLVALTGFTNATPERPMVATWITYGVGAIAAFFLLVIYHRAGRKPDGPTSRPEPTA